MDPANLIGVASVLYVGGTVVLHRMRLARSHRDGLELSLLRRIDAARIPAAAEDALAAYARAEAARVQADPETREREAHRALAAISGAGGWKSSPGLAYLDAQVRLAHLCGPVSLEWIAMAAVLRLRRALKTHGNSPELHLGLAHAHAMLGQSTAALDELGRAVYYANGDTFYSELVLASEFVERTRPRLRQLCLAT